MKNSKKWLLSLGSVAAVAAPVAAVVACGSNSDSKADAEKLISDYIADAANKVEPTIKTGSETKTSDNVVASDLEIADPTDNKYRDIKLTINSVTKDIKFGTVKVIVKVSSKAQKEAATKTYTVLVPGFKLTQGEEKLNNLTPAQRKALLRNEFSKLSTQKEKSDFYLKIASPQDKLKLYNLIKAAESENNSQNQKTAKSANSALGSTTNKKTN